MCLLSDGVVFGKFHSLVGTHTGGTEVLNTVHTKAGSFSVVITGHTELQRGEASISWPMLGRLVQLGEHVGEIQGIHSLYLLFD